jgi:hypothetical protein
LHTITRVIEHTSRSDTFTIYPLGDVHIGHRGSREDALSAYVKRIAADPNAYWIGLGDYLDCIMRHDPKRFDVRELALWMTLADQDDIVKAQRDRFLVLTRPIWGKCLGLLKGNHEDAIRRHHERDVYGDILSAVAEESPYCTEVDKLEHKTGAELAFGYSGILRLVFRRGSDGGSVRSWSLPTFLHHGAGGGKLKGAKALNLQRVAGWADVGLVIMGHVHDEVIEPVNRIGTDTNGNLVNNRIMTMVSGTFLDTWCKDGAAYVENALYPPGSIGTPYVVVRPGLDEAHPLAARERVQVVS